MPHDDPWIFSFENICHALDLVPDHHSLSGLATVASRSRPRGGPLVNRARGSKATACVRAPLA
jgi:hypothetical protein